MADKRNAAASRTGSRHRSCMAVVAVVCAVLILLVGLLWLLRRPKEVDITIQGQQIQPQLFDQIMRQQVSDVIYEFRQRGLERVDGTYHVFLNGGRVDTGLDALEWIRQGVDRGAGEVVVNSIDTDGVKQGFDLEMLRDVSEIVHVPVIASGGAGGVQDFVDLFREIPDMSAGLAASIFHFGEVAIPDLKQVLRENGVCVRL